MKKKKILFIAPYPFDEAPSQRFRFEQYFNFLRENNFDIHFSPFLDQRTWKTLYSDGKVLRKILGVVKSFLKRFLLLFTLYKYDFVFIHREASHIGPPFFEFLIAKVFRKKYNYDFDDAIWLPNYSETNARFHRLKAYWKVRYCIRWAGSISAGNDYLANYARKFNANVQVIPTTIDTENHHNLKTEYNQGKLIIGWTGTHTTMRYLDFIVPVIKELEQKYDFEFLVISNEAPTYHLKSLRFLKWKRETEITDLARISIGVMPLEMDIWSEGKCGFKGLQYMSLGIPALMSPIGVNTQIVSHEVNGFLPVKLEEWKNQLEMLLTDIDLRKKIGEAGKKTIDERYSVLSNQSNYLSLFQ
ncbi:MAG: glycosyltransferase family 4 protein [Bacteroidetes bacterium]|nr:glycosyltransferase family 4 protein [Bacteroidota bacterium]